MNTGAKRMFFFFLAMVLVSFCGTANAEFISAAAIGLSALIGGGLQAWGNYAGMKMQERENRRAEAIGMQERAEDIARSEKWAGVQQRFAEKQFQAGEQQRKINNAYTARNALLEMMAGNTQMANNISAIWRGRRAA
jgi:hypothetical protein